MGLTSPSGILNVAFIFALFVVSFSIVAVLDADRFTGIYLYEGTRMDTGK